MNRSTRPSRLTAAATFALVATTFVAAQAQPPEPPPRGPRDPLRAALDANHDFTLDADEIAKAPEAIKTLDTNGDGVIDREELRPPMGPPPGGRGRGPGGLGDRPPRDGESGRPPRDRAADDERPRPPRDGGFDEGPRFREGQRPGGGTPGERPSPERFVARAMRFDANGDGRLDESELRDLADAMAERMRDGRGPGGPPRDGGDRPERPRRPE
jgi:hypothetical protein